MDLAANTLPDDIDALKATLLARDEHVADLQERLSSRETEIKHLKLVLAKLRRMKFSRKSEKLERQIEQLELRLEDLQTDEGAIAAAEPKKARQPRDSTGRKLLPDHLGREKRVDTPATDNCLDCGGKLKALGEDLSEQLVYVRSHFRVILHRRLKLAFSCCDCIVQAAAPSRPIDRGHPGPALLAHITTSKFAYQIPLCRQSVMYARDGVEIDPGTMGHWLGSLTWLLNPLVDAVRHYALGSSKTHTDDMLLPVLAPGHGRTKTGYLWVYARDDRPSGSAEAPAVWFAYSPDRGRERPQKHLANYSGILQADGFTRYRKLYEDGHIQEVACWAHAHRRVHDLHVDRPSPITTEALKRIGALYRIEEHIRGKPSEERQRVRQAQALPLLGDLKRWFEAKLLMPSAKSDTTKAIQYSLNRWSALVYYCSDGQAEIDNLIAERALRGVAIGRWNYLFAGAESGGERAAPMYSLIGSHERHRSRGVPALRHRAHCRQSGQSHRRTAALECRACPACFCTL